MKKKLFHKINSKLIIVVAVVFCSLISIGIVLSFFMPGAALAKDSAVIKNIKLTNTRDDLLTYFTIKKAFTPKINQAVLNGIPTTFSFYVTLYNTQGSWFDTKVSDIQITSTLKYNSLKKNFSILRPWKDEKPVIVQSFEEAKVLMTDIDNLKIISLKGLVKGDKYQLRIKAKLDRVTLPLSLHSVLFFVSFWDFETNWYLINFVY